MSNCTFLKRNQHKFSDFPIYFNITYSVCTLLKKEKNNRILSSTCVFKRVFQTIHLIYFWKTDLEDIFPKNNKKIKKQWIFLLLINLDLLFFEFVRPFLWKSGGILVDIWLILSILYITYCMKQKRNPLGIPFLLRFL